jgi:hypothetical protein
VTHELGDADGQLTFEQLLVALEGTGEDAEDELSRTPAPSTMPAAAAGISGTERSGYSSTIHSMPTFHARCGTHGAGSAPPAGALHVTPAAPASTSAARVLSTAEVSISPGTFTPAADKLSADHFVTVTTAASAGTQSPGSSNPAWSRRRGRHLYRCGMARRACVAGPACSAPRSTLHWRVQAERV